MIKQEKIEHNGILIKILCDTEKGQFTLFNLHDTNAKGHARSCYNFYKSHDIQLCKNVCSALLVAIAKAEEILKT